MSAATVYDLDMDTTGPKCPRCHSGAFPEGSDGRGGFMRVCSACSFRLQTAPPRVPVHARTAAREHRMPYWAK